MNVFAKAKASTAPASKDCEIEGVKLLSQLKLLSSAIEALTSSVEEEVKSSAKAVYVENGANQHKQPKNFDIVEDGESGNFQVCKRSTRSPLAPEEVEVLERFQIPFETQVAQEERYAVNPAYANDQELLQTVSDKLSKIKGLPEDFIVFVPEKSQKVVSDNSIDCVFRQVSDLAEIKSLLEIVSVEALKVKPSESLAEALKAVTKLL